MAKYVGEKTLKKVIMQTPFMGTGFLSNMGELKSSASCFTPDDHLIVIPPASKLLPVSAISFIFNDKLSLTTTVHPSLGTTVAKERIFFDLWMDYLQEATAVRFDRVQIVHGDPKNVSDKSYLYHSSVKDSEFSLEN